MIAHLRNIRISPRKANLVAGMVRKLPAEEALLTLKFMNKKAAPLLYKVVQSAVSNAVNNDKKDKKDLIIDEIIVNEGKTLKRGRPISRGRWNRILKRTSHLTVKLTS